MTQGKVTGELVDTVFRTLCSVYREPDHMADARTVWLHQLREYDARELTWAVNEYMATDARVFPKPGQLKAMMRARRIQHGRHQVESARRWKEGDGPCPICGEVLRLLAPTEQVFIDWTEDREGRRVLADRHATADPNSAPRWGVLHNLDAHDGVETPFGVMYGYRAGNR